MTSWGWTLLAHSLFLDQLEKLTRKATGESTGPDGEQGPATKLLGHVLDLIFDKIPQDPSNPAYRHGGTLGGGHRQWFRAKTGDGRFRLFFRFHSVHKMTVYAWLNDEQSLRTYGASTNAYAVFARMLAAGNPPADWNALVAAALGQANSARLRRARAQHQTTPTKRGRERK
jgi:toxin YhaV